VNIMAVSLNVQNFSYFSFHPKSDKLSPQDQRIALLATILLALFTPIVGHLCCAIVYRLNRADIQKSLIAKTDKYVQSELEKEKNNIGKPDPKPDIKNKPNEQDSQPSKPSTSELSSPQSGASTKVEQRLPCLISVGEATIDLSDPDFVLLRFTKDYTEEEQRKEMTSLLNKFNSGSIEDGFRLVRLCVLRGKQDGANKVLHSAIAGKYDDVTKKKNGQIITNLIQLLYKKSDQLSYIAKNMNISDLTTLPFSLEISDLSMEFVSHIGNIKAAWDIIRSTLDEAF
jgi:hypothetical protein